MEVYLHKIGVCFGVGCVNKNLNFGHNLNTTRDRVSIFHICIHCDKIFHIVPYVTLSP